MSSITPADVSEYASSLARACTGIAAVWLIGSRANGTEKETSDWDLLVFGDVATLECLKARPNLHRGNVDCLALVDGEFRNAWGQRKSLTLKELNWEEAESHALYTEHKWSDGEGSTGVVSRRMRAVKLWGK